MLHLRPSMFLHAVEANGTEADPSDDARLSVPHAVLLTTVLSLGCWVGIGYTIRWLVG